MRIKIARRQRPSPSGTVPPQTDHRPSAGGRAGVLAVRRPKCRHGTDRPAPGEIGPLAYRTRTLFCARKPRCRPATAPSPGPATAMPAASRSRYQRPAAATRWPRFSVGLEAACRPSGIKSDAWYSLRRSARGGLRTFAPRRSLRDLSGVMPTPDRGEDVPAYSLPGTVVRFDIRSGITFLALLPRPGGRSWKPSNPPNTSQA